MWMLRVSGPVPHHDGLPQEWQWSSHTAAPVAPGPQAPLRVESETQTEWCGGGVSTENYDSSGQWWLGDIDGSASGGSAHDAMRAHMEAARRFGAEVDGLPHELSLLQAIQEEDGRRLQEERRVTIIVPEGVREDRKVRVCLANMHVELEVPEGSAVGAVVTCDRPMVGPLDSQRQKHILQEEILMTRLRWWEQEDGSYVTDEARKQKKLKAYWTLRGRNMGIGLLAIAEEGQSETWEQDDDSQCEDIEAETK